MTALPRPLVALGAAAFSATLLGVWPDGRSSGLVAAALVFAVVFAAAWASRKTPLRAAAAGFLAGLIVTPLPLAVAAGLALYRLARVRPAANDNHPPHWNEGFIFAP